jgi:hypothetical protein
MLSDWLAHWMQQVSQDPMLQARVAGGTVVWVLWKSLAYWWSGFKRFPGSLLTAFIGTVLGAVLVIFGWKELAPQFPSTLFAAGAALGACGVLDLVAVLLTSKGKKIGAGWLGALFALVWTATLLLVGMLVSVFPIL